MLLRRKTSRRGSAEFGVKVIDINHRLADDGVQGCSVLMVSLGCCNALTGSAECTIEFS